VIQWELFNPFLMHLCLILSCLLYPFREVTNDIVLFVIVACVFLCLPSIQFNIGTQEHLSLGIVLFVSPFELFL
jgi:hypothetical protein